MAARIRIVFFFLKKKYIYNYLNALIVDLYCVCWLVSQLKKSVVVTVFFLLKSTFHIPKTSRPTIKQIIYYPVLPERKVCLLPMFACTPLESPAGGCQSSPAGRFQVFMSPARGVEGWKVRDRPP